MDLVDEEDRLGVRDQHLHHGLQPLLEVAAVARAREHGRHVERVQHRFLQRLRDVARDDPQREPFRERGLAHARLADEQRVVLPASRQHLDHPLELVGAANQGIDLTVARALGEIHAEALERVRHLAVLLAGVLDTLRARHDRPATRGDLGHAVRDEVDDIEPRHTLLLEQVDRVRVALAEHRCDHVARRHLLTAGGLHVHRRALQHPLERQRLVRAGLLVLGQRVDLLGEEALELAAELLDVAAALGDGVGSARVIEDREQQVLERQVLVAARAGVLDGALERRLQLG